ncbi:MAG: hypothetical protein MJE77_39195 [Proteobacteria bacterium]|nr:hypothetical protein [Pseudomonadota bacterium]
MAYWTTHKGLIGDGPANEMDDAVHAIRDHFRRDLSREPTKAEIRDVVEFVLAALDDLPDHGCPVIVNSHGTDLSHILDSWPD